MLLIAEQHGWIAHSQPSGLSVAIWLLQGATKTLLSDIRHLDVAHNAPILLPNGIREAVLHGQMWRSSEKRAQWQGLKCLIF